SSASCALPDLHSFPTRRSSDLAYCGRRPVPELLARLRSAPLSQTGELEAEASGEIVRALVAVLLPLVAQIQQLSAAIAAALPQRSEEHTSELQSRFDLVCRLLL